MSENFMVSKTESNTKRTRAEDDHFSLYIYLDHFVHEFFIYLFLCIYLAVLGLRSSLVHIGSLQHMGSGSLSRDWT